jgi:hypothetical protein
MMFHNRRQFLQRGLLTTAGRRDAGSLGGDRSCQRTLGLSELPTVGMIGIGLQDAGCSTSFFGEGGCQDGLRLRPRAPRRRAAPCAGILWRNMPTLAFRRMPAAPSPISAR